MKRYIRSAISSISDLDWHELGDLASDPRTPDNVLSEIAATADSYTIRYSLLENPSITTALIDILVDNVLNDSTGADSSICSDIIRHPKTSKQALKSIFDCFIDKDYKSSKYVWEAFAQDPKTPVRMLQQLSKSSDWLIRTDVANNPNASASLLTQMLKNNDNNSLAFAILSHPNATVGMLIQFANSKSSMTRSAVASSPNTPIDILIKLSEDSDCFVRRYVAENKNTPTKALKHLTKDVDPDVCRAAQYTLNHRR